MARSAVHRVDRLHPGLRAPGRASVVERCVARSPNVRRDGEIFARAAAVDFDVATGRATTLRTPLPGCATPVHVLPNPVLLESLRSPLDRRARDRASRAGVPPRCLFIGGDFRAQGGLDLLEAWRTGRLRMSRADLTIVTDWHLASRCRRASPSRAVSRRTRRNGASVWRGADHLRDADPERGVRPRLSGSGGGRAAGDRHATQCRARRLSRTARPGCSCRCWMPVRCRRRCAPSSTPRPCGSAWASLRGR